MIKDPNGVELRNLQEQVLKNKEDIAAHYNIDRVLADFGIKVKGQVRTPEDLPPEPTYKGDYGDAYAVGPAEPYDFYVWTRADIDSGHYGDYWFNIGKLAIVGPQGPQGDKGDTGAKGERTNVIPVTNLPTTLSSIQYYGFEVGDYALPANEPGKLYYLSKREPGPNGIKWDYVVSIIGPKGDPGARGLDGKDGPRGPEGPKGQPGDVGGFVNIWGILTSQEQLPPPSTIKNLTAAYLIGTANPRDLYVQVGQTSEVAVWKNTGPFNAATLVMVGGSAQNVWNADTKADLTYVNNQISDINAITDNLGDSITQLESEIDNNRFVMTNQQTMTSEQKRQARENIGAVAQAVESFIVYGTNSRGQQMTVPYNQTPYGNGIAQRTSDGRLKATTPVEADDLTTKEYTDKKTADATAGVVRNPANLIKYPYPKTNTIENGITWTINPDGTIIANGTATERSNFRITQFGSLIPITSDLFFTSTPKGGSAITYFTEVESTRTDGSKEYSRETGSGLLLTKSQLTEVSYIIISIAAGQTVNNLIFKPMLNKGDKPAPYYNFMTENPNLTVKVEKAIPSITDINTFRKYFYDLRKSIDRHYQFEIANGGEHYDLMSILGYPPGVSTAHKLFLYVDLPYSEAGGFKIDLTLMGRTSNIYYQRRMFSTLNANWQDSGWFNVQEQMNSLSMCPSKTIDMNPIPTSISERFIFNPPSNGILEFETQPEPLKAAINILINRIQIGRATLSDSASKLDRVCFLNVTPEMTIEFIPDSQQTLNIKISRFIHAKEV